MNLKLIEIIDDGAAKTFVYQDLDNPDNPPYRVTYADVCQAIQKVTAQIQRLSNAMQRLSNAMQSTDFQPVINYLKSFN